MKINIINFIKFPSRYVHIKSKNYADQLSTIKQPLSFVIIPDHALIFNVLLGTLNNHSNQRFMAQVFYGNDTTIKALSKTIKSKVTDEDILQVAKDLSTDVEERMVKYSSIKIIPNLDNIYLYVWLIHDKEN